MCTTFCAFIYSYVFGLTGLSKQWKPKSDAAGRGFWSGSILFVAHPAVSINEKIVNWIAQFLARVRLDLDVRILKVNTCISKAIKYIGNIYIAVT